jgi:hypothetical protein
MPEKGQPTFESLSRQLTAAQDRAHKSSERAAQQFTKLLGTVLGGLGVAIAAWLQRIFEHPVPLSPLAWYLAFALFFVALGLAALALTTIIDQRSAYHAAKSIQLNSARSWNACHRQQIAALGLTGDEKSARELGLAVDDEDLERQNQIADARAARLNAVSEGLGLGSWGCLVAAFIALGIGIVETLKSFC